ncbi:MAG: protein kinase [Nocardioides sp.]|nr:protein kinase [Nocardioides sp.]
MQSDRHADGHARAGAAAPPSDPVIGRLLDGRYRIGARIARGGMASVYEATDIRLDRTVAVKVMHPGLGDDDEFAARFVREARSAARLSHPNVVAVFDQGDDDGIVFLAMELVEGHTLRDVIRKESPMVPARALALLEPVVSALAAAHRAGLVHRDVKPENVLIATDPHSGASRIKVADFGLAKAVSADTQHTATGGVLIGTVSYLAPELVVDGRADARADVYAVGVVLYELLTGSKPHEGESPIQVAYKHVHEDVPPPSRVVPEIPAYVDALVARATARDRGQRPADAAVLLHQLHRVSQALAEGVRDDPELTADLAPMLLPVDTRVPSRPGDTAADPWDAAEMAALMTPATSPREADRTTAIPTYGHPEALPRPVPGPPLPRTPRRPRRSKRGLILLVLALLVAATAGGSAWWFGYARYTTTPGVIGMTRADAVQKLEGAGLAARIGEPAYSETVGVGRVIGTDPDPSSRVLDGGTVTLTVSLGKERYDVPRLHGLTEVAAQQKLMDLHLTVGTRAERWSDTVPAGKVIGSAPKVGTTLRPGAAVDLIVSKGPQPIRIGNWVGDDAAAAKQELEARGLVVDDDQQDYSDTVPEGAVISQSPRGGFLFRGETVTFVVSQGPELVEVPNVVASGVDDARRELEARGFKVEVKNTSGYLGLGYVFSTDPGHGAMVPKGSTITLYLV